MASEDISSASSSTQRPTPPSQKPSSTPKVDVSIEPTSHLDPGAYVRGPLPIRIGHDVLIHPRVYLLSIHSPLTIGSGSIIGERAVLGGPAPTLTASTSTTERAEISPSPLDENANPTTIGESVHICSNALISHGATIGSYTIIEANTSIGSSAVIGQHSKISAGLTITGTIPDWTVVWGSDGDQRRRRRRVQHDNASEVASEAVERERLKAMQKEREGTIGILKATAAKSLGGTAGRKR